MRLGVMIGAERGDMARKVKKLLDDIEWAEGAGLDTAWMPQVPNDFDVLTMIALMGVRTTRIELGTAVVPLQAQHPIALARQAMSVQAATGGRRGGGGGRSGWGRRITGSCGTCSGCRTRVRPVSPGTTSTCWMPR